MKEELQTRMFNWIAETSEKVGNWTSVEIPEFIKEFLTWRFYSNAFDVALWLVFLLIALGLFLKWGFKFWKWGVSETIEGGGPEVMAPIMATFIVMLPLALSMPISSAKECIQIKVAPKVYLVEYAAKMLKK